ncbi:hypothetical protein WMZ06_14505, partial [Bacillus sp. SW7]|uniref:hypothetical protein n=1 Tax=Bacillus sp. SW7 TaxID=3117397 RepID=UPI00321FB190
NYREVIAKKLFYKCKKVCPKVCKISIFCRFTKMKQKLNENACDLFIYIVNSMSELVGGIHNMLAKGVPVV